MIRLACTLLAALALWGLAPAALAQHDHPEPEPPAGPGPTQPNLDPEPGWPKPVMDTAWYHMVLFEQLEFRPMSGAIAWDMVGWYGGDYNRLWIKSEGDWLPRGPGGGEAEVQALYGRLFSPFFDWQVGLRYDAGWGAGAGPGTLHGVIGVQGLAPYLFEVEPALFLSQYGDLSARFTASRALLLTQRTFLEGRFEGEMAFGRLGALAVRPGELELGLRLIHQLRREFAPYAGVTWSRRFDDAAAPQGLDAALGVQAWF